MRQAVDAPRRLLVLRRASEAAETAYRLSVMPTSASARAARIASTARPWPSSRWCAARTAAAGVAPPGRVITRAVAEERRAPRLVERGPVLHPVAERAVHERGVLGEPGGGVAGRPAAGVLERLRQVPVVEREPRLDAVAPAARRRAGGRSPARPGWPGRRRPAAPATRTTENRYELRPSSRHQRHVVAVAVVVVDRRRGRCARPRPRPGCSLKVSQMDGVRPSVAAAPSIWYAAVAAPQRKPSGKRAPRSGCGAGLDGSSRRAGRRVAAR